MLCCSAQLSSPRESEVRVANVNLVYSLLHPLHEHRVAVAFIWHFARQVGSVFIRAQDFVCMFEVGFVVDDLFKIWWGPGDGSYPPDENSGVVRRTCERTLLLFAIGQLLDILPFGNCATDSCKSSFKNTNVQEVQKHPTADFATIRQRVHCASTDKTESAPEKHCHRAKVDLQHVA